MKRRKLHKANIRQTPFIANFPNGRMEVESNASFHITNPTSKRKADHSVFTVETSGLSYQGVHKPKQDNKHFRFLVALEMPSGDLEVVPAKFAKMQPVFETEQDGESNVLDSPSKRIQARTSLIETFGGKRKKSELTAKIRNKVSDESLSAISGIMDQALDKSMADGVSFGSSDSDKLKTVPPYDLQASTPRGAYPLQKMFTEKEMKSVTARAKTFMKAGQSDIAHWKSANKYAGFIYAGLVRLSDLNSKDRAETARVLVILNELIKFRQVVTAKKKVTHSKLVKLCSTTPDDLLQKFISVFLITDQAASDNSLEDLRYQIPAVRKDLLIAYILVLVLHACGFEGVDIDGVASELKLTKSKLVQRFRALGCNVDSKHYDKPTAHLNVPLLFPKPKLGRQ